MDKGLIAKASVTVQATVADVWEALINPLVIKKYMFGTDVKTNWKKGGSIIWKGRWKGEEYEDKGTIIDLQEGRSIKYTHFSPLSGLPDKPENYHTVTILLSEEDDGNTRVSLSQDNNPDHEARERSEKNWDLMLTSLKKTLEGYARPST